MLKIDDSKKLRFESGCEYHTLYWMNVAKLDQMRSTNVDYCMWRWIGPPSLKWYILDEGSDDLILQAPCVQIWVMNDKLKIHFNSGLNRTRWMMNSGLTEVPVAVYNDIGILKASNGLITRPVISGETIEVFNNFDTDKIITQLKSKA